MNGQSFYDWLMRQTERDDNTGELARWIAQQSWWPQHVGTKLLWIAHLRGTTGAHFAEQYGALDFAWIEWRAL